MAAPKHLNADLVRDLADRVHERSQQDVAPLERDRKLLARAACAGWKPPRAAKRASSATDLL